MVESAVHLVRSYSVWNIFVFDLIAQALYCFVAKSHKHELYSSCFVRQGQVAPLSNTSVIDGGVRKKSERNLKKELKICSKIISGRMTIIQYSWLLLDNFPNLSKFPKIPVWYHLLKLSSIWMLLKYTIQKDSL